MIIRKSCDLLESGGVNFAPGAITTGCFSFKDGTMGCPTIAPFTGGKFPADAYFAWREAAIARIENRDINFPCTTCPLCVSREWPERERVITYVVVSVTPACQLDCHYCWSVLDGSKHTSVQKYDVLEPLRDIVQSGLLAKGAHVCVGGGEPTILPSFDRILNLVCDAGALVELPTNAVKFSLALEEKLRAKFRIEFTSSLDCGTREGFIRERGGKDYFDTVLENLSRYYAACASSIHIKYIVTHTNSDTRELDAFIALMNSRFPAVKIKIDSDLRAPLTDAQLYAIAYLYRALKSNHQIILMHATKVRVKDLDTVCRALFGGNFLVNLLERKTIEELLDGTLVPGLKFGFDTGFYPVQNCYLGLVCWTKQQGEMQVHSKAAMTLTFRIRTGHFPLYGMDSGKFSGRIYLNDKLHQELPFTVTNQEYEVKVPIRPGVTRISTWCERTVNAKAAKFSEDIRDLGLLMHGFYAV